MTVLKNVEFGGERPLFALQNAELDHVTIHVGESSLKHVKHLAVRASTFEGKYPFWHAEDVKIEDSTFTPGARAAIWYAKDISMTRTKVDAPKMFRDMCEIGRAHV